MMARAQNQFLMCWQYPFWNSCVSTTTQSPVCDCTASHHLISDQPLRLACIAKSNTIIPIYCGTVPCPNPNTSISACIQFPIVWLVSSSIVMLTTLQNSFDKMLCIWFAVSGHLQHHSTISHQLMREWFSIIVISFPALSLLSSRYICALDYCILSYCHHQVDGGDA